MEPRFNMFANEIGAKFAKRFANVSLVIAQSSLPTSTQELVALRASQINGCGWCVEPITPALAHLPSADNMREVFQGHHYRSITGGQGGWRVSRSASASLPGSGTSAGWRGRPREKGTGRRQGAKVSSA